MCHAGLKKKQQMGANTLFLKGQLYYGAIIVVLFAS
jgi:hypothetical protein